MRKSIVAIIMVIVWCSAAYAQQLPSGLETLGIQKLNVSALPACSPTSAINQTYWLADSLNTCTFGNAITGGGTNVCKVMCDNAASTWRMWQAPDIAPPNACNVVTGAGSCSINNCVLGGTVTGCATGIAQGPFANTTISTSNFNVINSSLNMTQAVQGANHWNYSIMQNNGSVTCSGSFPTNNGCHMIGTIASVTNATTFVANAPTATDGTCAGADMKVNDTTATVFIWDGKDAPGIAAAETAASTLSASAGTGGVVYLPAGTYMFDGNSALASNTVLQCQSPTNTFIVNPDVGTAGTGTVTFNFSTLHNITVENCTIEGMNTNAHADANRENANFLNFGGRGHDIRILNNILRWDWGDQGINFAVFDEATAAPCVQGQGLDTNGTCAALAQNVLIANNLIENCAGFGLQVGAGIDVTVTHNQFLDCDPNYEDSQIGTVGPQMLRGISLDGNDIYCDATGNGKHVDAVTGSCAINNGNLSGCVVNTAQHQTGIDWTGSSITNNHIHALNASPPAHGVLGITAGNSPLRRGNTCIAGENCSFIGGF